MAMVSGYQDGLNHPQYHRIVPMRGVSPHPHPHRVAFTPVTQEAGSVSSLQQYENRRNLLQCQQNFFPGPAVYLPYNPEDSDSMRVYHQFVSVGSIDTSHVSGSTYQLDLERDLTPGVLTPTSSQASGQRDQQNYGLSHRVFVHEQEVTRFDLRGLAQSPPTVIRAPYSQNGVLGSPLGRSPGQLQSLPAEPGPWNPIVFRSENPGGQVSVSNASYPNGVDTSTECASGANKLKSVRVKPLEPEQRAKASHMRTVGVCLRCSLNHESCDIDEEECKRCQTTMRKWRLGCVRVWLEQRLASLQPDVLGDHLSLDNFNAFKDKNTYDYDYSCRPSFRLRVGWGIGPCVHLWVKEIEPFGPKLLEQDAFWVWLQTRDDGVVECIELQSPPLLPDVTTNPKYNCDSILKQIMRWVTQVLDKGTDSFVWHCFWQDSKWWQRETLMFVWEYHRAELKEHQILTDALRLVALNHLLTCAAVVPKEDVIELYQKLESKDYHDKDPSPEIVSPRAIDRLMKSLIYPIAKNLAQKLLKDLQTLLLDKTKSNFNKDLAFCLAFLLMMVLGKNQNAVLDMAKTRRKRSESGLTEIAAKSLIGEMENDIADHVIGLYEQFSQPSQKKQKDIPVRCHSEAESHSTKFGLFEKLQQNYASAEKDFALPSITTLPQNLQEIDDNFSATNLERLLVKFYTSVNIRLAGPR